MTPTSLVMIGNGMAGVRTLEELVKLAPGRHTITVFSAEPHPNYNRVLLSPVLAGEQTLQDIVLNPLDWYAEHGITLHLGCRVTRIDRARRRVHGIDDQGREVCADYDRLLIATGSTPFMPPLPGRELAGVMAYRDIADTEAMIAAAARETHAVVIGGGVLGLEAANGLAQRGMDVTVLHLGGWLMERQLDARAGALLRQALEQRGLRFALQAQTAAFVAAADGPRVAAVRLADGRELPAGLVVVAAGIRPANALAREAGLLCALDGRGGIVVDDTLQTVTDPRIYAVGECASHRGTAYGLVAPVYDQAMVCATHLAGLGARRYRGSQVSTKLKVTGIDLYSAGDFLGGPDTEEITLEDGPAGAYRKLVLRDGRLVGTCLYGDTAHGAWYLELIRDAAPLPQGLRPQLMFGPPATA
ncbi:MAG: hypothetical protein RLY78_627 [Pseudomonadota bacterium]|jgi:nitrite reductase (NADH) large subunit|uniref:FAD-dependent oxidoreductase n=1 Tax=Pseudaquabacterium rugosum TaxID=2984194 RepID=A0ABU9B9D9_9BURK